MSRQEECCGRPVVADLFCGAGGMSLGFEQAGFHIAGGVDIEPRHLATFAVNFPYARTIHADIAQLKADELRDHLGINGQELDVVIGGPPCQAFSICGRRAPHDPRRSLVLEFGRLVVELRPSFFVMENVPGLLMGSSRRVLDSLLELLGRKGYMVLDPFLVDAVWLGVPQRRRRVFLIGYRRGIPPPTYPLFAQRVPTLSRSDIPQALQPPPTVWDAIGDLPNIDDFACLLTSDTVQVRLHAGSRYAMILRGEVEDPGDLSYRREWDRTVLSGCRRTIHSPETVKRFSNTQPGKYEPISRFYRLPKHGVANTLRAGTGKAYGSHTAARPIHPVYPRCICVREAARLHSFPDWFRFDHTTWWGFMQVGNSVPPLVARAVARALLPSVCKSRGAG